MAEQDQANENARRQLEAEREISDRSRKEYEERSKGKPTPTQEENDLAALGAHITEHEEDGSGPDPNDPVHNKSAEGTRPSAGYQTRQTTPQGRSGEGGRSTASQPHSTQQQRTGVTRPE